MKKPKALLLLLALVSALTGCSTRSMHYIIANKPSVIGIVEEVQGNSVILYAETAEGYPGGSRWSISLDTVNRDSYTDLAVGDKIVVYYDGPVMETDPLQVSVVYAITLEEPADRDLPGNDEESEK